MSQILQDLSQQDLLARIQKLEADNSALAARNAKLAAANHKRLSFKVTEKGGVSAYGLGQWPVTLYRSQWERLLEAKDTILAFIEANADVLSDKADKV
jgi:hypothetical protein